MRVELLGLACAFALSGCQMASSTHEALVEPPLRPAPQRTGALSEPASPVDAPATPADAPVFDTIKGEYRALPAMRALPIVDLGPIRDALLSSTQETVATAPVPAPPPPSPTAGLF